MLIITDTLTIPDTELSWTFSHSGGPGGQNVNKVETRATVSFDVAASPTLSDSQRHRIMTRLASRITTEGILSVTAQDQRTQLMNRETAANRLAVLIRQALTPRKRRIPTRTPKSAHEKRIQEKKRRGEVKKMRGKVE